jgi:hypothetical protein
MRSVAQLGRGLSKGVKIDKLRNSAQTEVELISRDKIGSCILMLADGAATGENRY